MSQFEIKSLDGHRKRYVAAGAGKTAVIRQLEIDWFGVVEEPATDVVALWPANGIAEPWTRPEFIDAIISLQQARERRAVWATDSVQFHDSIGSVYRCFGRLPWISHAPNPAARTAAWQGRKGFPGQDFVLEESRVHHP